MSNVIFTVGSFSISWFGLFLAVAYLWGVFLFWRWGRKDGFSSEDLLDLAIISSISGLAGGKFFPMLFGGITEIFWVGATGAGLLAFYLYVAAKKWSFFRLADLAVIALSFGQAVGLLGARLAGSQSSLIPAGGFLLIGGILLFLRPRLPKGITLFSYLILGGLLLYFSVRVVSAQVLSLGGALGLVWIAIREWFKVKRSNG